ncbi:MAG: hypothetical protein JXA90_06440, partial [Planctomycetes bacterium]|nr:hypothetical protein [Planctomycetota bacterium]
GQYLDLHEVQRAVDGVQGLSRSQAGLVDRDDLWDEWWILVLFTALLSLEWILRKMVRLL